MIFDNLRFSVFDLGRQEDSGILNRFLILSPIVLWVTWFHMMGLSY